MTHEHGSASSGEEVKDSCSGSGAALHSAPASSSSAAPLSSQPSQCSVFFAPAEWSRRYGEDFYTARVTHSGLSYAVAVQCADSAWSVERPYSAFRSLASDMAAHYRPQPQPQSEAAEAGAALPALPALPADKGDAADMQRWMDSALQRKDISRLPAVRRFLNLDISIQRQHEQVDTEDEEQTAAGDDAGGAESKQTETELQ